MVVNPITPGSTTRHQSHRVLKLAIGITTNQLLACDHHNGNVYNDQGALAPPVVVGRVVDEIGKMARS
jgi:hypothetical protein